ncbi:MAG: cobalt-precorrin 5A hydrolase, partial [Bacillota bacterium]|nr:cobalt-precorrin 5A hydrolase [Bacillota bacterium]
MKIAVIALTKNGSALAMEVKKRFNCHAYIKYPIEGCSKKDVFTKPLKDLVEEIINEYQAFIMIMATGIVFRTFAPYVESKYKDPAILVMDEKGRFAISFLSGHIGGGNELAQELAEKMGATAVITTATDVNEKIAFDMVAKKNGLYIENPKAIQDISEAIVNDENIY